MSEKSFSELDTVTDIEEFKEEGSTSNTTEFFTKTVIKEQETMPVTFTKLLQNKEAICGETVEFICEMTQMGIEVTWYRNNQPLMLSDGRYQIVNEGSCYKLVIANVTEEDFGEYTIKFGDFQSSAVLINKGQTWMKLIKHLYLSILKFAHLLFL